MMNDPEYFEKWMYTDNINAYNSIIEELQILYEQTPAADRTARAKIFNGMKQSKGELAKTQHEYETFKKYKMRTAISK